MKRIFVDANVLLGFWKLADGRICSDLLLPLVELTKYILVTKQLVDEVDRNKLKVFLQSTITSPLHYPPVLPEHLTRERRPGELNIELAKLKEISRKAVESWQTVVRSTIADEISANKDLASTMLEPLFRTAVEANDDQVQAARVRRERGNPPGKSDDPLGDQISWEQFLAEAKGAKEVWIVTRDGDYLLEDRGRRLLNPLLSRDLQKAGVEKVNVHDNLAAAILSIKSSGIDVPRAPTDERLKELEKMENQSLHRVPPYIPPPSPRCPSCGGQNTMGPLVARPSQFGGWTYQFVCRRCGSSVDTGEYYDD